MYTLQVCACPRQALGSAHAKQTHLRRDALVTDDAAATQEVGHLPWTSPSSGEHLTVLVGLGSSATNAYELSQSENLRWVTSYINPALPMVLAQL